MMLCRPTHPATSANLNISEDISNVRRSVIMKCGIGNLFVKGYINKVCAERKVSLVKILKRTWPEKAL